MNDLDKETWDIFKKQHKLTEDELANEVFCEELRNSLAFNFCRVSVALKGSWSAN